MSRDAQYEVRIRILEILGRSIRLSAQLRDFLEAERDAMEAQNTELLHTTLSAKRNCIETLKTVDKARISCCEQAGFKYSPRQMEELCEWCDKNSIIRNLWTEQLDIVASCQKLNDTIGAIIHARRSQISRGLAVLCGTDPNHGVYGPHGTDPSKVRSRDLAEA
ncbi:MAG TPA: flagellar protein FlgN [Woeseiaceae bacterium]|nr:flagellar protein FlgN [Woeseiaceae bacterium]